MGIPVDSGANLGVARGAVVIDTSQTERAAVNVQRVGTSMRQSFEGVGVAAKSASTVAVSALKGVAQGFNAIKGELVAINIAAAGLVGLGIKTAASWQQTEVILKGMVGSEREAVALMESLRRKAAETGTPYAQLLDAAKALLPLSHGNTEELSKQLDIVRRLAVLNPAEGVQGASFALAEVIAAGGGDLISLRERFRVNRADFKAALKETNGDILAAMDIVLNSMGATEEAAEEMSNTFGAAFSRVKDSFVQLVGDQFTGQLDSLTEGLNLVNDFLNKIGDSGKKVLGIAAMFAVVVAAVTPLILLLGTVLTTLAAIAAVVGLPVFLALAALGVMAAVGIGGGMLAGIAGASLIGKATGNEKMEKHPLQAMLDGLLVVFEGFAKGLNGLITFVDIYSQIFASGMNRFVTTLGLVIQAIGEKLTLINPAAAAGMKIAGQGLIDMAPEAKTQQELLDYIVDRTAKGLEADQAIAETFRDAAMLLDNLLGITPRERSKDDEYIGPGSNFAPDPLAPTDDELAAFEEYQNDLTEIAEEAQADRIAEEADYQERLTDLNEDYNEAREKIAEDAQDRILDLEKRTADQIADIRENAADREAKENADYQERIADLQTEYQKDEIRRLQDFQREEERAKRQHNITLLTAAASLDAKAIWQENMRYNQQRNDAQEDFNIETDRRTEQLQERLQQEQEGHEDRLEEAREADEKRIEDLREHLAEERLEIQEDAAEKLAELDIQHAEELNKLAVKHKAELDAIDLHETDLTNKRTAAFKLELDDLGTHYDDMLGVSTTKQEQMRKDFEAWLNSLAAAIPSTTDPYDEHLKAVQPGGTGTSGATPADPGHEDGPGNLGGYARGGLVPRTGRATLHAGERVLSPDMTAMINRMAGGHSDAALLRAFAGGAGGGSRGGSKSIHIENFNTPVLPGMDPREVRQAAYDALTDVLTDLAGDD